MTDTKPATSERVEAPRQKGQALSFISDDGFRASSRDGVAGVTVRVRLTSYRSLPLSCIREVGLTIDGESVDTEAVTFVLNGNAHRLADLKNRTDLWWYILDPAEIFVPRAVPLTPGEHEVAGYLSTIVPFATGGRSTETQHSSKRLTLDPLV